MGTRCQIGFYSKDEKDLHNWEALIYRHWDGYPKGVLPDLLPVLREFDKGRGLDDVEYASAWLVKEWKKDFLNIGISKDIHGDIEYFYAVYPDRVDVWAVVHTFEDMAFVKSVPIHGKAKVEKVVEKDTTDERITLIREG